MFHHRLFDENKAFMALREIAAVLNKVLVGSRASQAKQRVHRTGVSQRLLRVGDCPEDPFQCCSVF